MFDTTQILPYLLDRQILNPETVISERIRVANVTQRNQNFLVTNDRSEGWFLKQGTERSSTGTVCNEAAVYQTFQRLSDADRFMGYLPQYIDYDADNRVLSLQAIQNPEDLQSYYIDRNRFPKSFAKGIGRSLGNLHQVDLNLTKLDDAMPSVLQIHRPPIDILKAISNVGIKLMQMLQQYGFGVFFEDIVQNWRPESIIHCDVKLSNFVAFRAKNNSRFQGIKIIDWEFAGIGDPRWDVGSVFASYLHLWISSVPITDPSSPDEHLELAKFSLNQIQETLSVVWQAYCETRQLEEATRREWLLTATKCAAARLIQTAYELSNGSIELSTEIVTLVQTSLNIFQNPELAITQLFGVEKE